MQAHGGLGVLCAHPCMLAPAAHACCWHVHRHLRDLMADEQRCAALIHESEGIIFDFSRQRVVPKTLEVSVQAHTDAALCPRLNAHPSPLLQ